MGGHPLTANETTLLAAVISAVTSFVIWLLAQKYGPNYKKQIADLTGTLSSILERHSAIADALASMSTRTESKWRPVTRIESAGRENHLILKSDREFKIKRIAFLAANSAVLSEFHQEDWDTVRSTGFNILLPQAKVTQLWNESSGPRNGWATGTISVEVSHDEHSLTVPVPFVAKQAFETEGATTYAWTRLTG